MWQKSIYGHIQWGRPYILDWMSTLSLTRSWRAAFLMLFAQPLVSSVLVYQDSSCHLLRKLLSFACCWEPSDWKADGVSVAKQLVAAYRSTISRYACGKGRLHHFLQQWSTLPWVLSVVWDGSMDQQIWLSSFLTGGGGNLKSLKALVVSEMETVQSVQNLLQIEEWAVLSILHILIHRVFRKFLCFLFNGKAVCVLPFSLVTSLHVFTMVVKAVVGQVHLSGVSPLARTWFDSLGIWNLSERKLYINCLEMEVVYHACLQVHSIVRHCHFFWDATMLQ